MFKRLIKKFGWVKLKIVMSNGNVIYIKCKNFESSKLSGNRSRTLTIEKPKGNISWTIDVDKIDAIIATKTIF